MGGVARTELAAAGVAAAQSAEGLARGLLAAPAWLVAGLAGFIVVVGLGLFAARIARRRRGQP